MFKYAKALYFYSLLFFLDQITKYLVYKEYITQKIITPGIEIVRIFNRGISLGIGHSEDPYCFFIISSLILCFIGIFIAYAYTKPVSKIQTYMIHSIIIGALSNMVDRYRYHGVLDFIQISIAGWHFPAFNFADTYIVIGCVGLCMYDYLFSKNNSISIS